MSEFLYTNFSGDPFEVLIRMQKKSKKTHLASYQEIEGVKVFFAPDSDFGIVFHALNLSFQGGGCKVGPYPERNFNEGEIFLTIETDPFEVDGLLVDSKRGSVDQFEGEIQLTAKKICASMIQISYYSVEEPKINIDCWLHCSARIKFEEVGAERFFGDISLGFDLDFEEFFIFNVLLQEAKQFACSVEYWLDKGFDFNESCRGAYYLNTFRLSSGIDKVKELLGFCWEFGDELKDVDLISLILIFKLVVMFKFKFVC